MANEVYTQTTRRQVAVNSIDTWPVDFSPAIGGADTVVSGTAILERVNAAWNYLVTGFVTSVVVNATDDGFDVLFNANVLTESAFYELRTRAVLASGAVVIVVTPLEAV